MRFDRAAGDGNATAYTIGVERLDPVDDPALEPAGYRSETTLFVVMTGSETIASHDTHKIARQLPGDARWVIDELRDLNRQVNGVSA